MSLITKGLGGIAVLTVDSAVGAANQVTITFSTAPSLIGIALDKSNWSITNNATGDYISINSITVVGVTIVIATSQQVNGATYTVHLPVTGIVSAGDGSACTGPFTITFAGVGTNPAILMVQTVDTRTINIIFNKPVYVLDALNTNNYSIDNGLTVTGVVQLSNSIFQLKTSKQVVGTAYTVTASNIRDEYGNVV